MHPAIKKMFDRYEADGVFGKLAHSIVSAYRKKHSLCLKCGEPTQYNADPENPLCVGCASDAGGGNDESTDPEMKSMEARDLNKDEGDK